MSCRHRDSCGIMSSIHSISSKTFLIQLYKGIKIVHLHLVQTTHINFGTTSDILSGSIIIKSTNFRTLGSYSIKARSRHQSWDAARTRHSDLHGVSVDAFVYSSLSQSKRSVQLHVLACTPIALLSVPCLSAVHMTRNGTLCSFSLMARTRPVGSAPKTTISSLAMTRD